MPISENDGKKAIISILLAAATIGALSGRAFSQTIEEFPVPTPGSSPQFIAAGPDGNLWFTESSADRIGRISPGGVIVEFPLPSSGSEPWRITTGPDGALWFTELLGNRIGRISVEGQISEFSIPTPKSLPFGIVAGPDGALWFTERETNKIGRIAVAGQMTEFPLVGHVGPNGITRGGDGALWFAEEYALRAGRLTTEGAWTEVTIPSNGYPFGIESAADGSLWITAIPGAGGSAVQIPTTGSPVNHALTPYSPGDPAIDASGNLWYAESDGRIGRLDRQSRITTFTVPSQGAYPVGIAITSDGKIWFTESGTNKIGRLDPASSGSTCTAPAAPELFVNGNASANVSAGTSFTLSWTSTLGGSPGSYTILRSDSGGLGFSAVGTTPTTSLVLAATTADAGHTMLFEVRATRDCTGTEATSGASNAVSVAVAALPPPPPPPAPPPPAGCTTGPDGRPCRIVVPSTLSPAPVDRSQ